MRRAAAIAALCAVATGGCAHGTSRTVGDDLEVVSVRHHYNNAHVLVAGGRALLVDAGTQQDAQALDRDLAKQGIDPETIVAVVLTHGHVDHAGGAKWFRDHYGTPIVAGADDAELLARGRNDELCPTDRQGRKRLEDNKQARFDPYEADVLVTEPLDLTAEFGFPAVVTPVPGHTRGSVVVVSGAYAVVGDLFRGSIAGRSAERHFYMCDQADNDRDIASVLRREASEAEVFFVGHFGPLTRDAVIERFGGQDD